MKLGLVLTATGRLEDARSMAVAAEQLGFDLVLVEESPSAANPLVLAAALAHDTTDLRVVVATELGADHPIYLAEEAAVTDLSLGGRLGLVVEQRTGDSERFSEALTLLRRSLTPRPFRHDGSTWCVPAGLATHEHGLQDRVRVTPAPAQPRLPLWVRGPSAIEVALRHGLPPLVPLGEAAGAWQLMDDELELVALDLPRPVLIHIVTAPDGTFDESRLVETLRDAQRSWGLNTAIFRLSADLESTDRRSVMARLAGTVRASLQLDSLPPGLDRHWREHGR